MGKYPGPFSFVDEIEVSVSRMTTNYAPVLRILHTVDEGAVASRRFPKATSIFSGAKCFKLAVNERYYLIGEIICVVPYRFRVNVLIASQGGKAVRENNDTGR